jgi:hypothetical protein
MLLVSCHGGERFENILAYRDHGVLASGRVLCPGREPLPKGPGYRGMCFAPDGALWLLNGSKHESAILRFVGSKDSYQLAGRIAVYKEPTADTELNSLWHPFELAFAAQDMERRLSTAQR